MAKTSNSPTNTDVHYVFDMEMDKEESGSAMDWRYLSVSDDSKYYPSEEEVP